MIKVDDTAVGIAEGLNSGTWTVAVTVSGNEVGMTEAEWNALPKTKQDQLREQATEALKKSGAHYIIDSVADLEPIINAIEQRIQSGEKP